jgi:cation transport regulator ChaB
MPAAATAELVQRPKDVKAPDTLSGHAADIWRSAFLSAYSDTCKNRDDRDACAAKIAWSAVKQSYRKNKEGQWVERAADPNVAAVDTGAVDGGAFATPVEPDRPIIPTPQNLTRGEAEVWNRVYLEAVKGACAQQDNPQACAAREAWEAVKAFGEEAELDDEITAEPEDEEEPTEDEEADAEDEAAEGEPADDEEAVDDEEVGDAKESAEADTGEEEAPADAEEEEAEAEPAEEEEPADEEAESEEDEEEEDEKDQRRRVRKSLSERSDGLTGKGGTMAPKEQVYTERQMQALIAAGRAMPDGRLPIVSKADVSAAVESFAKANAADPAVIRHIIVRAGSLGALELLPDTWINRGTATMISKVDEQWLKAAVTRIAETLDDLQWLSGIGEDTTITRPTDIPSTVWRTLPAIERSARAEYLRTFVRRMYEQAVDDMRVAGWRAEPMVGRPHEFQFKKFVETGEGPLLVRAILVRKAGTKVWLPREISRGASLSTAVMMLPDELRP